MAKRKTNIYVFLLWLVMLCTALKASGDPAVMYIHWWQNVGKSSWKKTSLMLTTCKTYFKWTVRSVIFCLIFTSDHFLLTSSKNLRNYFQLESEKDSFLLREWYYSLMIFMAAKRKSFRKSCKIKGGITSHQCSVL